MIVELTEIAVCPDCSSAIAYDDYTGLDLHYEGEAAEQRAAAIAEGIADICRRFGGFISEAAELGNEFEIEPCECCGSRLAGGRLYHSVYAEAAAAE